MRDQWRHCHDDLLSMNKKKALKSVAVLALLFLGLQGFVRVVRPVPVYVVPAPPPPKQNQISVTTLKFETLSKDKIDLDKYKGKVVIINFFATWCPPCRLEIPHFVELENTYKKLAIIGISVDQAPELLPDFIKKMNINYPVALQTPEMTKLLGNFQSIPTTFIIDKNGHVVETVSGYQDKAFWEAKIKHLL